MAFSLNTYIVLLNDLATLQRQFLTMSEHMLQAQVNKPGIMLRHDVDRKPNRSVSVAKEENALGVKSTYYFRCSSDGDFNSSAIKQIAELGHEVGYHYECLSDCKGNHKKAISQFEANLAKFRQIAPCQTVSMHGKPLSRHDNLELLKDLDLNSYSLCGDAVHYFEELTPIYFTDTGGSWNNSNNLRDHVGSYEGDSPSLDDFSSFRKWFESCNHDLYISTHPERWPATKLGIIQSSTQDFTLNIIKRFIEFSRWFS